MRKLISLLLVTVMVMSLATAVFAAEPTDAGDHSITAKADLPTTITLAAGEIANYSVEGEAALAIFGKQAMLTGTGAGKFWVVPGMYGIDMDATMPAVDYFNGHPMMGPMTFAVENTGTETATYTLTVLAEPGTIGNPEPLDVEWGNYPYMSDAHEGEFYYTYTAGENAEVLKIKDVVLSYNALNMANVNFNIMLLTESGREASLWTEAAGVADEVSILLGAGETVNVMVRAQENEPTYNPPSVEFAAEILPVTEIAMAGDYVVEADEAWYAVNSMLAGYIIAVNGDDAAIEIDGTVIPAVDGLATAVLNGEGAVIAVKVTGATDMIILPAPTEINAAGDYEANVAAGAEVEYAINSMLAGATLTVKGEGAYIYMGGTKYEAVDGVATAILDGEGATIAVKVGNASETAGAYALNIAYAPEFIDATGDYEVAAPAGAALKYVFNSRLAGAILTVEGEGAYIVMGETKVEAVDGVASIVLDGEGATIAVEIGNAGTAAADYKLTVAFAPEFIDAVGDYKVTVPAAGEVTYLVNSKLDGAIVTVKGEGVYLVVNGTKVEAKNGVATATLSAKAATIELIIGNAGTAAAELTVNVAAVSNDETGDFGVIAAVIALATSAIGGTAVIAKKKEN